MNVISTFTLTTSPANCLANPGGKSATAVETVAVALPPNSSPTTGEALHRLGEVRQQERLTRRSVARRLSISVEEVEKQELPSSDMLLSDLYRWQEALGVPVAELLNEPAGELSPPVRLRARLLRAMKTVRSIQEATRQSSVQRMAEMLANQLVEIMPELASASAWPTGNGRHKRDDLGQAFFRGLSLGFVDEQEHL